MLLDEKQIAKELTIAILQKLDFHLYDGDNTLYGEDLFEKSGEVVANLYKRMCFAVSEGDGERN